MTKFSCTGNDITETIHVQLQWVSGKKFDAVKNCSCRGTSIKVLKTTYCINKIKNGYKDVEKNQVAALVRSGTCSKYREIEREVVLIYYFRL